MPPVVKTRCKVRTMLEQLDETDRDILLKAIAESGEHKVTMAIETASAKLQAEIGKVIPDDLVLDRVRAAFDAGLQSVKLYFMVGLPGEGPDDVAESVRLIRDITEAVNLKSTGGSAELDIGISCFVPKGGTPWQDEPMADEVALRERINTFRKGLAKIPYVKVQAESTEMSVFQGILSIGDKSLSEIIISAAEKHIDWRPEFRWMAREAGWFDRIYGKK